MYLSHGRGLVKRIAGNSAWEVRSDHYRLCTHCVWCVASYWVIMGIWQYVKWICMHGALSGDKLMRGVGAILRIDINVSRKKKPLRWSIRWWILGETREQLVWGLARSSQQSERGQTEEFGCEKVVKIDHDDGVPSAQWDVLKHMVTADVYVIMWCGFGEQRVVGYWIIILQWKSEIISGKCNTNVHVVWASKAVAMLRACSVVLNWYKLGWVICWLVSGLIDVGSYF